jgi:hypothetical protein
MVCVFISSPVARRRLTSTMSTVLDEVMAGDPATRDHGMPGRYILSL